MRPRNLPRQGQSQPRTLNAAGQRIVRAIELLENPLFATPRHAQTAVKHFERNTSSNRQLNDNILLLAGIFFGVRD